MNKQLLKQLESRAKQFPQNKGRPVQMTSEIIGVIVTLRKKKLSYRSIYEAMKEKGLITYKSAPSFYISFKTARGELKSQRAK